MQHASHALGTKHPVGGGVVKRTPVDRGGWYVGLLGWTSRLMSCLGTDVLGARGTDVFVLFLGATSEYSVAVGNASTGKGGGWYGVVLCLAEAIKPRPLLLP